MPETAAETITRIYRAIIAEHGTTGTTRNEAVFEVVAQVQPLINAGSLQLSPFDLIRSMVIKADESDGARADSALADIASGADDLSLDADPVLDLVVTLGRGRRKTWRNVTAADLDEMDAARYANVRSVTSAYRKKWKPQFDAWNDVLRRHRTIGDAVEAGDLPHGDAGLFDAS